MLKYWKLLKKKLIFIIFFNNSQRFAKDIMSKPFQIINLFQPKEASTFKTNQWPKQDLIKYAVYLNFTQYIKQDQFEIDYNSWAFFRKLSIFIQSKNPNQCRVFHKRIMSDHSSITSLLSELKQSIHKFQEWEQHYEHHLMNIKACLKRKREQIQKQLSSKKTTRDQTINCSLKVIRKDPIDYSLSKEQKELGSVGLEYQDNKPMKPSTFETTKHKARPALSFNMQEQQILADDDLSMFNSNARSAFLTFSKEKTSQKSGLGQVVRDCQNSFQIYLGKLTNLSTFMSKSFQNY